MCSRPILTKSDHREALTEIDRLWDAPEGSVATQPRIRVETEAVLGLAVERLEISDAVEVLAESFATRGLGPMDSLHLALASTAKADFFATCDHRLLRKAQTITGLECRVISTLALLSELIP